MSQFVFFDADKRLSFLSAKGDPLEMINRSVAWEDFRADIERVVPPRGCEKEQGRSQSGRFDRDVPDAHAAIALQPVGRTDVISGARPAFVHTIFWSRV